MGKRKFDEYQNNHDIFYLIPVPLWSIVFNYIYESVSINDRLLTHETELDFLTIELISMDIEISIRKVFQFIRLTCKLFRNLVACFWKQYIPYSHIFTYMKNCLSFSFLCENISLKTDKDDVIIKLNTILTKDVKRIQFNSDITDDYLNYLPDSIEYLDIRECNKITTEGIKNLPISLKEIIAVGINTSTISKYRKFFPINSLIYENSLKEGQTILHHFILDGDIRIVNELLDKGYDINKTNTLGETCLSIACAFGQIEIVKILLKKDIDIYHTALNGNNPVHVSCIHGEHQILQLLVEKKFSLNLIGNYSFKPIHLATITGNKECINILLDNGISINEKLEDGITPLTIALRFHSLDFVKYIFSKGGDLNVCEERTGLYPTHIACYNFTEDCISIMDLLIKKGCSINLFSKNVENSKKVTVPLSIASEVNNKLLVSFLIKNGALINVNSNDIYKPLSAACYSGHKDIVELLLNNDADINILGHSGRTPLHFACQNGKSEIVQLLIERGVNIHAVADIYNYQAIHFACRNGYTQLVKILIKNGADINKLIYDNCRSIHLAAKRGSVDIINILVNKGVDVNAQNIEGMTPLFIACIRGYLNTAKILIDYGADIDATIKDKRSNPLLEACLQNHVSLVRLLLKECASVNVVCHIPSICFNKKFVNDEIDKNVKYYTVTPPYLLWLLNNTLLLNLILSYKTDIELCVKLAEQNNHIKALQFFKSLTLTP